MQISCEIISIDEERGTAILNFHAPDEQGKDKPVMVMITEDKLRDL
jgi:hypothetical protein